MSLETTRRIFESYIIHIDPPPREEFDPVFLKKFFSKLSSPTGLEQRRQRKELRCKIPAQLLPPALAASPRFASRSDPLMQAPVLGKAIYDGVLWVQQSPNPRRPIVYLSREDLNTSEQVSPGTAFRENACKILGMKGLGVDLTRVRDLVNRVAPTATRAAS